MTVFWKDILKASDSLRIKETLNVIWMVAKKCEESTIRQSEGRNDVSGKESCMENIPR